LILFIEKVAFDSHSLVDHHHEDEENVQNEPLLDEDKHSEKSGIVQGGHKHPDHEIVEQHVVERKPISERKTYSGIRKGPAIDVMLSSTDTTKKYSSKKVRTEDPEGFVPHSDDSDIDEETLKMIVSSKGKFASYMQNRNICNCVA
jgi:hypothetical protein